MRDRYRKNPVRNTDGSVEAMASAVHMLNPVIHDSHLEFEMSDGTRFMINLFEDTPGCLSINRVSDARGIGIAVLPRAHNRIELGASNER